MMDLIVLFVDICLFKKGPQDVPVSRFLFGCALLAYWAVGLCLLVAETDWWQAVLEVIVESLLLLGFAWGMLYFVVGKPGRFLQTATALLATDAVISTPGALFLQWWMAMPEARLFWLGLLILMVWQIAVVAHILRRALERSLPYGYFAAIIYFIATYQLMSLLFDSGSVGS